MKSLPEATVNKPARDLRIDVVRGLILLIIFINHMPGNIISQYTPYYFGFSDSSEVFVLLAGVSAVLAYGRLINQRGLAVGVLRIVARVWTLYVAHLMVFLIACGVIFFAISKTQNPLYVEVINIQPFLIDPVSALLDVLTLVYQPSFLNIIPLYIVLLAVFPLVYWLVRIHPIFGLLVSLSIWQAAVHWSLNFPDRFGGGWFFNPLAWQLVFTFGVLIGHAMDQGYILIKSRLLTALAILVVLGLGFIKTYTMGSLNWPLFEHWVDVIHLSNDKMNQSVVRIVHLLALVWIFCSLISSHALFLRSWVCRGLASMGRHSLAVFCVGTVLSIMGQILMAETAYSLEMQLIICITGGTLLFGLGAFLSWYQSLPGLGGARRTLPLAPVLSKP
ncbi:hypothetical protein LX59_01307 [Azomonas agilis]|uniref:OpgC protein n=1 Tax=Azomonas agilis TaxID=116849 RepID=A0A562IXV4_9GAMM|nr:OpgC domain-containing protein [Azomonas agilis]TWH75797.1 hypothetical protein LX59_01307 [Azomonas agilis]